MYQNRKMATRPSVNAVKLQSSISLLVEKSEMWIRCTECFKVVILKVFAWL